jgi:hypothetical protein
MPQERSFGECEAEIERLAKEAEEWAAEQAREIANSLPEPTGEEYTLEDKERDNEFGRLEAAREQHFAVLDTLDEEEKKKGIKYPFYEHMVDGLMPLNEVHIIAGESGAGKSTWLFQFIHDWQQEKPVLGRKSTWYPYVVFVNDRTKAGTIRTLQRLKLNPRAFPIVSTITEEDMSLAQKIKTYVKVNPLVRIIFVEGFHVGQVDGNDYGESSSSMRELNAICVKHNLTIVATTHVSKVNASNGKSDRTSIIGSNATPAMSETAFILNKVPRSDKVKLTVHPRNSRSEKFFYKWSAGGSLIETDGDAEQDPMVSFLNKLDTETFSREDVIEFFTKKKKLSESSGDKAIKKAKENGLIANCLDDRTGKERPGRFRKAYKDDEEN